MAEGGARGDVESAIEHIEEAQTTGALIVAPATADVLAKFAQGLADDFLSTMYLATKAPVIVAPAMNVNMWEHPATGQNLRLLRERGVTVVAPGAATWRAGWWGAGGWRSGRDCAGGGYRIGGEGKCAESDSGGRDGAGYGGRDAGADRSGAVYREPVERKDGLCAGGGGARGGERG